MVLPLFMGKISKIILTSLFTLIFLLNALQINSSSVRNDSKSNVLGVTTSTTSLCYSLGNLYRQYCTSITPSIVPTKPYVTPTGIGSTRPQYPTPTVIGSTYPYATPTRIGISLPASTPTPTGIGGSVTVVRGSDGTWCYDMNNGINLASSNSRCQDNSGSYTDSCESNTARQYYCTSTWNGTSATKVKCAVGGYVCPSGKTCSSGACL